MDKSKQLWDYVNEDKNRFLKLNEEGKKTYIQYGYTNGLLKDDQLTDKARSYLPQINSQKVEETPIETPKPTLGQSIKGFIQGDYNTGNKFVDSVNKFWMGKEQTGNKALDTITRTGQQGANMFMGAKEGESGYVQPLDTGSKGLNTFSDVVGGISGFIGGAKGTGVLGGNNVGLMGRGLGVGQQAAAKLGQTGGRIGKIANSRIGYNVIEGAVPGALMDVAQGLKEGDNAKELTIRTGTGALLGAVVDAGAGAISPIVKNISSKLPNRSVKNIANQSVENLDNVAKREPILNTAKQADKAKPVLNVESNPIKNGNVKERGFSENIRTDANRVDELRKSLDNNPEFYDVLNNKDTLESAQTRFSKGYEEALQDFELTKAQLRADNVPLAKLLADEATRRGDMTTARRVIVDIAENLTTAGQYSQAAKILRDSNDPSAILSFIQKELQKLNTQGLTRYGKKWTNIDLTDAELEKIQKFSTNATDEEKEKLFEEIYNNISTRIPTTNMEKFNSLRRIAMLLNPKTHIRNIFGNTLMAGVKQASDLVAEGAEKFIPQAQRTKSFRKAPEALDIASKYWDANKKDLTQGGRWELFGVSSPFADKKIFNTKVLSFLDDISKKSLEGEDRFFLKRHFVNDLAGFMTARGLKEPNQEAIDYALRRAQEATFREANSLADAINKSKGSKAGFLVEAAIPFTKTPANIAKTGIDYSPIGLLKGTFELFSGRYTPQQSIEELAKGLTGSGVALIGYYMAKNGLARGDYKKDRDEEAILEMSGMLPNSIKIPNGSYTVDWAQPSAIPFFMGVSFYESLKQSQGDDVAQAFFDAMVAGGDTVINQTMLSNIKDLFSGYGSTTEKIAQLPVDYLTQTFPTIAGQTARVIDPTKRQRDYTSQVNSTITGLQSRTPFASFNLPPKRDIYGQPQIYGKGIGNTINQYINPGNVAKSDNDPTTKELLRLYESQGKSFLPRQTVYDFTYNKEKYELDNKEISEFQRIMGEYTKRELDRLFNSSNYKSYSDEAKAKAVKRINDTAYDLAKKEIIEMRER